MNTYEYNFSIKNVLNALDKSQNTPRTSMQKSENKNTNALNRKTGQNIATTKR